MKVNKIDHICIAVKNLDEARKTWEPVLGKSRPDDEYIDEPEKIKVARYWVGGQPLFFQVHRYIHHPA